MEEPGRYWHQFLIWLLIVLASYGFWRWLVWYLLPFLLALILAAMIKPVVVRLRSWGFGSSGAVVVALGSVLGGAVVLLGAILTLLTAELVQITHRMPSFLRGRPLKVGEYLEQWNQLRSQFGLGGSTLNNELRSVYQLLGAMLRGLAHTLVQLPEMALMLLIASLAAFFVLRDESMVRTAIQRISPPWLRTQLGRLSSSIIGGLGGYVRAEFALVSLTGLATTGGLLLIRAPYAVLIGLTAGFLDLVPFMGPTILLVPWSLGAALTGHAAMAVHLLLVLAGVAVVRQTIEPRLVGQGTGLHPLVVLFSLYMGVRLFGAGGVLVGPITAVMFNALAKLMGAPREIPRQ